MRLSMRLLHCLSFALLFSLPSPSCGDEKEVFVAVGYGGRRMISEDAGKTWEITAEWIQPGKDDKYNIMGLVFAEGKFICVGGGGGGKTGGGHVHISQDGRTWKQVLEASSRANPVVWGDGRFVIGGAGYRQQLLWSDEGEQWTPGGKIEGRKATHWRNGAYGNGKFVLTGNNGGNSPPWIVTSKDGTSIDSFVDGMPSIRGLAFGAGRFVIVGMDGVRRSSVDGIEWDNHDVADQRIAWVVFVGEKFLCGTNPVSTSIDGVEWTEKPELKLNGVKWSDSERIIMTGWPGKMSYSHDGGETIHKANEMTANGINKVVRGTVGD